MDDLEAIEAFKIDLWPQVKKIAKTIWKELDSTPHQMKKFYIKSVALSTDPPRHLTIKRKIDE